MPLYRFSPEPSSAGLNAVVDVTVLDIAVLLELPQAARIAPTTKLEPSRRRIPVFIASPLSRHHSSTDRSSRMTVRPFEPPRSIPSHTLTNLPPAA